MTPITSHTVVLTSEQASLLRKRIQELDFEFLEKPYTLYAARKGKLQLAVYEKGPKLLLQGKDTEEFIRFELEPNILGEARLGYEEVLHPEMYAPHMGVDESGKGDFFGPLVISTVFVDADLARRYREAGVTDSKKIGSDQKIRAIAKIIKESQNCAFQVIQIGPEKYNQLYRKFGNLNRLLAWGHAKAIETLLEIRPDCPRALSDQFANPSLVKRALMQEGKKIILEQRTKAESDIAVAAASILARERFIDWMDKASRDLRVKLPRGASAQVLAAAQELVKKKGPEILPTVAKMHFRTAALALDPNAASAASPEEEDLR